MIRRDYILRMIEQFLQLLTKIQGLKKQGQWQQAAGTLDEEFKRLTGVGPVALSRLSETELLASLVKDEPTHVLREKSLLLTRLLQEAGEIAAAQNQPEESRACYLKGLHLLLNLVHEGDSDEWPDYLPRVEMFVAALQPSRLPLSTQAMLMQHYERTGQFAKAENALYAMLELEPSQAQIVEFGISFYERLLTLSDGRLSEGDLPRAEVETGVAELRARKMASPKQPTE